MELCPFIIYTGNCINSIWKFCPFYNIKIVKGIFMKLYTHIKHYLIIADNHNHLYSLKELFSSIILSLETCLPYKLQTLADIFTSILHCKLLSITKIRSLLNFTEKSSIFVILFRFMYLPQITTLTWSYEY